MQQNDSRKPYSDSSRGCARRRIFNPLGLTQVALAKHLGVPTQRINELIRGKRGVTPETAWLLASAFKTTPQFWLNLQANYDLAMNRPKQEIRPLAIAA